METSVSKPEGAAGEITVMEYMERPEPSPHQQKLHLDKHVMSSADFNPDDCCSDIKVDCLYEVDHGKLPPNSPDQLKAIRVVMVVEKTMIDVSVRFPSMHSLRECSYERPGDKTWQKEARPTSPELDEQFVMGTDVAGKVLRRPVPSTEFAQQKRQDFFWLVSPKSTFLEREEHSSPFKDPIGACEPELKSPEMVQWGVRRKARFIVRHQEASPPCLGSKDVEFIEEKRVRKRMLESPIKQDRKKKMAKREKITPSSKDRWSKERYEAAELKLMDIMRAKEAVLGSPILRPELRAEARKHIGDTGLLDHLLKHMAGKVVTDRKERFRRRHNPDGAMEYWLERADLIEIRKQAGVKDPFWAPPPGWKPGDGPLLDPACAKELKQLKEEMANMKRDFEDLLLKQKHEIEVDTTPTSNKGIRLDPGDIRSFQESTFNNLLKRKRLVEQQLDEISKALNAMQGEMRQLSEAATKEEEEEKKEEKPCREVRSGFRICKPQGTFLWPNSGGRMPPQGQWQVEDLLGVPTPTSASSVTSTPRSLQRPGSPAKVRTVTVSCVPEPHNCSDAWKLFGGTVKCSAYLSSQQLHTPPDTLSDEREELEVAELRLPQSDRVGVGAGNSSSSSSTMTIRDHLTCHGDTSSKSWLALATSTTSF